MSLIRKTAPKQKQIDKSSIIDDNFINILNIENLEDDLNYIRSQIKTIKGTISFSTFLSSDKSLTVISEKIDGYASEFNSFTINATDVNADTVNSNYVNVDIVTANDVNASDIIVGSIIGNSASIGPLAINTGFYPSDIAVIGDLIVTGRMRGNVASSDVTGTLFNIVAGVSSSFPVTSLETVTFSGTTNEITVISSSDNNLKIGISQNPTLSGNVTVTGNLTINGTTTTIDSQTLTVKDPIIQLNTGIGITNTNDLGLILTRGSGDGSNVGLIWDEQTDQFGLIYTNSNASDVNVDVSSYAKLQTGNLVVSSDVTIGKKIISYDGSFPNDGQILIGGSTGFSRGYITGASDTGVVVTSSTDSIVVSIDIDGTKDGTGITVDASDLLLLSSNGAEQKITVSQLGDLFIRYDINDQILTSTDQIFARTNISAVEIVKSTFTGNGTIKTFYIPHNLGTTDVVVQIFDSVGIQVFANVNTNVFLNNYISLTGNFPAEEFKVLIMGTRGTPITVIATETAPT